jgi:hypothetical protein
MRINLSALEALREMGEELLIYLVSLLCMRIKRAQTRFLLLSYTDELHLSVSPVYHINWFMTPLCGPCGINEGFGTGTIQKGVLYYKPVKRSLGIKSSAAFFPKRRNTLAKS